MAWLSLSGELDLRSAGLPARELLRVEGRVGRIAAGERTNVLGAPAQALG